ncbi:MAG: UDP-galactopyranose mutase [Rubricoccaceae bacterium]|nr:UDP-galactopyranose mutase [Rubricoccaceae bacterium]
MTYDFLIVGAGLTGSVLAEQIAGRLGKKVLIIDRRDHIGGNTFDRVDEHGVRIHQYGPHLFHTNSAKVWKYLSRFTDWHFYEHRVLAEINGLRVPVPFNLTSLHALFPAHHADRIESLLKGVFGVGSQVPIFTLQERVKELAGRLSDQDFADLSEVANFIYENVFYGYTIKQWGLTPQELGPSVLGRVPIRISHDDRYFQDRYQALPAEGYEPLVASILSNPDIHVETGVDFKDAKGAISFNKLIYTGPIDAYFDYCYGELPYRSLMFEFEHYNTAFFQERTQINYPNQHAYTRITEFKHATGQDIPTTTIAREYPRKHIPGENEPYYPIPLETNHRLFRKYAARAGQLDSVVFAGRLADYKYYNMDQAVARALSVFEKKIATLR